MTEQIVREAERNELREGPSLRRINITPIKIGRKKGNKVRKKQGGKE